MHVADDVERARHRRACPSTAAGASRSPPRRPPHRSASRPGGNPRAAGRAALANLRRHPLHAPAPPKARSGRARFRSMQMSTPGSSTIATGRACHRRAISIQPLRSAARTLVASITASCRCFSRLPAMARTRSNASAVTLWSVSSSDTRRAAIVGGDHLRRQKMLGREGRFARAGGADQHDQRRNRESRWSLSSALIAQTPPSASAPRSGAHPASRCREALPDSRNRPAHRGPPRRGIRRASIRNGDRDGATRRRQVREQHVVFRVRAWSRSPSRCAAPNTTRSTSGRRSGSRCSITSTSAAASTPAQRWSR